MYLNLNLANGVPWFKTPNVTQTEEPNIAETYLHIQPSSSLQTITSGPGIPAKGLQCSQGNAEASRTMEGLRGVRPQEGLGACFPLSSFLQASPQTSLRPRSPLKLGSVFLSTEVLEAAKTFRVPASKSAGVADKDAWCPQVYYAHIPPPPPLTYTHTHTHTYTKRERESC